MKIIKEKIWKWEFVCKACGSTCLAEASDVERLDYSDIWDNHVGYYFVNCGKCGSANVIPDKKITTEVGVMAIKKRNSAHA